MADNNKTYWKGLEELSNSTEFVKNAEREFPENININHGEGVSVDNLSTHRRDFLKLMGFSMAAVSLAACETPVKKAIPFLNKPEDLDPGIANWYASTYADGGDYCSILVKTREGRPIKIEGNSLSPITKGGSSARVQASVLSLYDTERYKEPTFNGNSLSWTDADKQISAKLNEIAASGGKIRIVSNTIISPTTKQVIADFKAKYPTTEHITYDPNSAYGIIKANSVSFGSAVIPSYHFDKANIIVSFGADFLGTWISPVEFNTQFAKGRKLSKEKKTMSRLYAFESIMTLAGANADYRTPVRASEEGLYVAALYNILAQASGQATIDVPAVKDIKQIERAAKDLLANKGKSLVVSGSNDVNVQLLINGINNLLNSYGSTIDLTTPSYQKQGNDESFNAFIDDVKNGGVGAIIFYHANPVYDHPRGNELKAALKSVSLKVNFADRPDETAVVSDFICPDNHYLESWGDAEPKKGYLSIIQPTISNIFNTRQAQESLLKWSGNKSDYYAYLQSYWKNNYYPIQKDHSSFNDFWNYTLHDGVFSTKGGSIRKSSVSSAATKTDSTASNHSQVNIDAIVPVVTSSTPSFVYNISSLSSAISETYTTNAKGLDLIVYEMIGIGTGKDANNPWLQEFPDPITRACWDNYLTLPLALANQLGVEGKEGNTVLLNLKLNNTTLKVPAMIQPGQAANTVGLAIGYGRQVAGLSAKDRGVNAYPLISYKNGALTYTATNVSLEPTGEEFQVAMVQTHHTVMGRPIIQESTLTNYKKDPLAGRYMPTVQTAEGEKPASTITIWNAEEVNRRPNHSWGMVIDLNSCTGCGACVISCQAENNVPVVGKQEVLNRREMHWIRIDRYYSSDAVEGDYKGMEVAAENPKVVFQPMLCQHCNNAPCETVCPVAATTHSTEGLNQMTYNRCFGTRYCANNCPYKVRRFNWFSYPQNEKFPHNASMNSDLGRMVLNPDVTVRSRGVMEKCSMCVQRIQEGKLNAKKEGRRPKDGEIITACAQACPTQAITFGDQNDLDGKIAKTLEAESNGRAYRVLEEINTKPNIAYLTKINNYQA